MKRILFAFDKINCNGGAHIANRNLIGHLLQDGYTVGIMSDVNPSESVKRSLQGANFYLGCQIKYHSLKWLLTGILRKIFHTKIYPDWIIDPFRNAKRIMEKYDVIVVCGELSVYRSIVSQLPKAIRKIQYIHTDYKGWIEYCHDAISFTYNDRQIYASFDAIAVVGEKNARKFISLFPEFESKTCSFHNLLNLNFTHQNQFDQHRRNILRLITLARIDDVAKDGFRMVRIASLLKNSGCNFIWDIYGGGDGVIYEKISEKVNKEGIADYFCLHGFSSSAINELKDADLFVLLSHFEGLPNVIYEALASGVPVFTTNVGSIEEQIINGKTGWLVEDKEEMIASRLCQIIKDKAAISLAHNALIHYYYDNESIYHEHKKILGL